MAAELGIADRIEKITAAPGPVQRDASVVARNPLGQVPTLVTDEGHPLFDSRVICEYLDSGWGEGRIFPPSGPDRWRALREQTVGDGLLDAAILVRYELLLRPEALRWEAWKEGQLAKIACCLETIEAGAAEWVERVDIGTITIACALGYLDFRFPDLPWRKTCPQAAQNFAAFARRPSMLASAPA